MSFISLNIKYLASYERLSQDDFGALFGLKKGNIGHYIRGQAVPSIDLLLQIANKYDISLDDIVRKNLKRNPTILQKEMYINEPQEVYKHLTDAKKVEKLTNMVDLYHRITELDKKYIELNKKIASLEVKMNNT